MTNYKPGWYWGTSIDSTGQPEEFPFYFDGQKWTVFRRGDPSEPPMDDDYRKPIPEESDVEKLADLADEYRGLSPYSDEWKECGKKLDAAINAVRAAGK